MVIFAFLSQLWDDVCVGTIKLSGGIPLRKHFPIAENQITLLRNLIRIYCEQKPDNNILLISDILAIADQFDENGEVYVASAELKNLSDNPTILDCYFAEKQLTAFFEKFSFLVNYKVVSMKKIECFNIKNIGINYLHHHDYLGRDKKTNIYDEMISPLFSYAVLLFKGDDYTQNINLFPFAIDINALNFDNTVSRISFFRQPVRDKPRLKYDYLKKEKDGDSDFELEYKGIARQKAKDNMPFLTDEEMRTYNKDCVYNTFNIIGEQLFI